MRRTTIIGLALLATVTLSACISTKAATDDTSAPTTTAAKPTTTKPAQPRADSGARISCTHFRSVTGDIGNSLLTDKIRSETKESYYYGQVFEIAAIRTATRKLLAASTQGDTDAYISAAKAMDKAGKAVGE